MGYISAGAVGGSAQATASQAVVDARAVIGDYLSDLKAIPRLKNATTKILPSNDVVFGGQFTLVTKPTSWPGSNLFAWPFGNYLGAQRAWSVLTSYVGSPLKFERNDTSVVLGIAQTSALLAVVDAKMQSENLPIRTSTRSRLGLYLGLAALGLAVFARKKGFLK